MSSRKAPEQKRQFNFRNDLDSTLKIQERNNERKRIAEFQERNRQTGMTSRQIATARAIGRERKNEIREEVNREKFAAKKVSNIFTGQLLNNTIKHTATKTIREPIPFFVDRAQPYAAQSQEPVAVIGTQARPQL